MKGKRPFRQFAILMMILTLLFVPACGDVSQSAGQNQTTTEQTASQDKASQTVKKKSTAAETKKSEKKSSQTTKKTSGKKTDSAKKTTGKTAKKVSLKDIPAYSGKAYVEVNGNKPYFTKKDLTQKAFETYSALDSLGRCGVAYANVCLETMPTEKRGAIGMIKPTGWHTVKYDHVDGKYLYNRCHLIGYQLTAENANNRNLITGTRYLNVDGMLPFENMVADYVKETENHVLYRVTPMFDGDDLVAKGVLMEAKSVEDNGSGISYCVFVYNVQPGVTIDYATGESHLSSQKAVETTSSAKSSNRKSTSKSGTSSGYSSKKTSGTAASTTASSQKASKSTASSASSQSMEIRGNSNSKIYHCPGQAYYDRMKDSKNLVIFHSEKEALAAGYRKAKR